LRLADLVMQTAQDIFQRTGMVILNKIAADSGRDRLIGAEGLHEEFPRVIEHARFDENDLWDYSGEEIHIFLPCESLLT